MTLTKKDADDASAMIYQAQFQSYLSTRMGSHMGSQATDEARSSGSDQQHWMETSGMACYSNRGSFELRTEPARCFRGDAPAGDESASSFDRPSESLLALNLSHDDFGRGHGSDDGIDDADDPEALAPHLRALRMPDVTRRVHGSMAALSLLSSPTAADGSAAMLPGDSPSARSSAAHPFPCSSASLTGSLSASVALGSPVRGAPLDFADPYARAPCPARAAAPHDSAELCASPKQPALPRKVSTKNSFAIPEDKPLCMPEPAPALMRSVSTWSCEPTPPGSLGQIIAVRTSGSGAAASQSGEDGSFGEDCAFDALSSAQESFPQDLRSDAALLDSSGAPLRRGVRDSPFKEGGSVGSTRRSSSACLYPDYVAH